MDVYSAKAMLTRMIEFVQQSSSSSTKMYGKSKDRFVDLKNTCYDLITALDTLVDVKFGVTESAASTTQANALVGTSSGAHTRTQVIANYHSVLKHLAAVRSGYIEADALSDVLLQWYEARFISHADDPNFKCNTKYLGRWLLGIAIGYGNALESNTGDAYLATLSTFADDLSKDFSTSKYVLPWEIHKLTKDLQGESVSLTGVVLWEILHDSGLHVLHPEESPSYLPFDAAKALYDKRPDDAPYYYSSYKHSDAVRRRIKLTHYTVEEDG